MDRKAAIALLLPGLLSWCASPARGRLVRAVVDYRIGDPAADPPPLLSLTGLYRRLPSASAASAFPGSTRSGSGGTGLSEPEARMLSDSIHPYQVNAPLWSDGAFKQRFITLPYGTRVVPTDSDDYAFPEGTVLIKNFLLDTVAGDTSSRILVETRFLTFHLSDGYPYYSGLSYRWRRDQSDADLVPPGKGVDALIPVHEGAAAKNLRWRFPSQIECNRCHVPESRGSLGFITPQLNRPVEQERPAESDGLRKTAGASPGAPGLYQLRDLVDQGVLAFDPTENRPEPFRWRGLDDTAASLEVRARSYLAANCSQCHGNSYNNHSAVSFDYFAPDQPFAFSLDTNYLGYLGRPRDGDSLSPQLLYPGHPDSSYILRRMQTGGGFESGGGSTEAKAERMPPLGTYRIDSAAVLLLRDWVYGLSKPALDTRVRVAKPLVPLLPGREILKGGVIFRSGTRRFDGRGRSRGIEPRALPPDLRKR